MTLRLGPVTRAEARRFVNEHHRHNEAPPGAVFQVGLFAGEDLVGVAMCGRPVARPLADGFTLEVGRTCVAGVQRNGNSMLYGACRRAAKALGYRRLVTYTLATESGSSLRAVGFVREAEIPPRSWSVPSRPRADVTLFGPRRQPRWEAKVRWSLDL